VKRQIVKIDEEKCTGCGDCVDACAEAAIEIVDGKARMMGEVFCDGLGACLDKCPEDALTIEEREAEAFDEHAVANRLRQLKPIAPAGCPSAATRELAAPHPASCTTRADADGSSFQLRNWPIQLALARPEAPFLESANLVLAADCTAFARPAFLAELAAGRPVLIACPKLDDTGPYLDKLTRLFAVARPCSLTIVHMTVPCCHGLSFLVRQALTAAGTDLPVTEVTLGLEGEIESTKAWPVPAETTGP